MRSRTKQKPVALITGINGQDGSYLAEFLLDKGYEVHGTLRRSSLENENKLVNISTIRNKIVLHSCNIEDQLSVYKLIADVKPDECYHLAASSFVNYSFDEEASIISSNFNSTHFLLSSIKEHIPTCRFYFAGTSEMFGDADCTPQNEQTRFNPRSIYGIAKVSSHYVVKNYRDQYGLYACTGIAYNHESPRRGHTFVTRKVAAGVAKIYRGQDVKIELGNMDAIRDWGYAPEYVQAMWMMLNNNLGPKDYVMATGISHSVKEFLQIAFSCVGLDYIEHVEFKSEFFRSSEKNNLIGDASLIRKDLSWSAKKSFKEIVEEMVRSEILMNKG